MGSGKGTQTGFILKGLTGTRGRQRESALLRGPTALLLAYRSFGSGRKEGKEGGREGGNQRPPSGGRDIRPAWWVGGHC